MRDRPVNVAALGRAFIGACLPLISLAIAATAQDAARARIEEMSKREAQIESLGATPKDKMDPGKLRAIEEQLQEDFTRILTLHNKMATLTASDKPMDLHFISDAATEIKKRATRLQQTLSLNSPAGASPSSQARRQDYKDDQLKEAVIALCLHIKEFVTNPVIENPGTVDLAQLARAKNDLDSVIELSASIKKTAGRLRKHAQ
jgi:hypothetical protein